MTLITTKNNYLLITLELQVCYLTCKYTHFLLDLYIFNSLEREKGYGLMSRTFNLSGFSSGHDRHDHVNILEYVFQQIILSNLNKWLLYSNLQQLCQL